MRVHELQTNKGILEIRVQKMNRENIFFIKLMIVGINSLFELYLAITCSVCMNILQNCTRESLN